MLAHTEIERQIEQSRTSGDLKQAVSVGIEGYGPELLGFLVNVLGSEDAASEVFSDVCVDLWTGIRGFRGEASFRTWAYAVARRAVARHHGKRRPAEHPLSCPEARALAQRTRTRTAPYLRTSVRNAALALRAELSPEDRALLVLRIDRKMAWDDIARSHAEPDAELSHREMARSAALLRKRFQRIKDNLKARAQSQGLLTPR